MKIITNYYDETLIRMGTADFLEHLHKNRTAEEIDCYALSLAVAKRARQLVDERLYYLRTTDLSAEQLYKDFHPISQAATEIYQGDVTICLS